MKSAAVWLALALVIAVPAHAWELINEPAERANLVADFREDLPPCEQSIIEKRLRQVAFTSMEWPALGDSWGFGFTKLSYRLLDDDALLERIFLHECGHMFDWQEHSLSSAPEFHQAVKDDFAAMSPRKAKENEYIRQPKEAFAELFSRHFAPLIYNETRYRFDLELLPRSNQVFDRKVTAICPE